MFWHDIKNNAADLAALREESTAQMNNVWLVMEKNQERGQKEVSKTVEGLKKELLAAFDEKIAGISLQGVEPEIYKKAQHDALMEFSADQDNRFQELKSQTLGLFESIKELAERQSVKIAEAEEKNNRKFKDIEKQSAEAVEQSEKKIKTILNEAIDGLEKSFVRKIDELKSHQSSQDMGKNAIDIAVAQEIVKRQFQAYEAHIQKRSEELDKQAAELNLKDIELGNVEKNGLRSKKEVADKLKELEEERLKHERMSNLDVDSITFDKNEIKHGVDALIARAKRDILKWAIKQ